MNNEQLNELLYQSLETELGGVQIYTTALQCVQNEDLKEEWEKYLEQTQNHVQVMQNVFTELELDPETETPGRQVVRHHGESLVKAMEMALKKAGMTPADIDYINAHGTSTMADTIELGAVKRLFGNAIGSLSMSSTKSAIGHLLGGAGAVESIFCILALRDQIVPPTLNLDNPSEGTAGVDLVPHKAKERTVRAVLNNSFGFGGTNASLIMKAV